MGFAQQNFLCKGKIVDFNTKLPLQDVRIYCTYNNRDTIETLCNMKGEFQISLQTGSKLLFKKRGYAWHVVKIANKEIQQISLKPSRPIPKIQFQGEEDLDNTDIYVDGQLVPREEWDDAFSMDREEKTLGTASSRVTKDKRNKIYIITL